MKGTTNLFFPSSIARELILYPTSLGPRPTTTIYKVQRYVLVTLCTSDHGFYLVDVNSPDWAGCYFLSK
jgi:hypothetical protein